MVLIKGHFKGNKDATFATKVSHRDHRKHFQGTAIGIVGGHFHVRRKIKDT